MNVIPPGLSLDHIKLKPRSEPRLIPWYYDDEQVSRLAGMVARLLPRVGHLLELRWKSLQSLASIHKLELDAALLVVSVGDGGTALTEVRKDLARLSPAASLIWHPKPQASGYGWIERDLKVPLLRVIKSYISREDHPLRRFGIAGLPVNEAAALTTDPLELADLLEAMVALRLDYPDARYQAADAERHLRIAAAERLAARLGRMGDGEVADALDVALALDSPSLSQERKASGALALHKAGLALYVRGDLDLGPLVRGLVEMEALPLLQASLKPGQIGPEARALLVAAARRRGEATKMPVPPGEGESYSSQAYTYGREVEALCEVLERGHLVAGEPDETYEATLSALRALGTEPIEVPRLSNETRAHVSAALRRLGRDKDKSTPRRRRRALLLAALVRFFAARGRTRRQEQEEAFRTLESGEAGQAGVSIADILRIVGFSLGETLLQTVARPEDGRRIRSLLEEAAATPQESPLAWLAGAAHVRIGDLDLASGQSKAARSHYQKAMEIAERLAEAEPDRADHQRDLSVSFERMGDLLKALGKGDEAREYHRKAMEIAERLAGTEPDRADRQLDLAVSLTMIASTDPTDAGRHLRRALEILVALDGEGRLMPARRVWIGTVELLLAGADPPKGPA